jgi:hypothetical protein
VPLSEVAARPSGDHIGVPDPIEIQRRIRRRIDESGLSADIVSDVNIVIATGGGTAEATQRTPIRQGRSSRAARDAPDPKEQP